MRTAINLIASHISEAPIEHLIEPCDTVCCFTAEPIQRGVNKKHVIKNTFTDHDYIKRPDSQFVGVDTAKLIMSVFPTGKKDPRGKDPKDGYNALRSYSFIATETELRLLKHTDLLDAILAPYEGDFVIGVSFTNKKHIAFKAALNSNTERFIVSTDAGNVHIERVLFNRLLEVASRWYSIPPSEAIKYEARKAKALKDGKEDAKVAEPMTYFTKAQIKGEAPIDPNRVAQFSQDFGVDQFEQDLATLTPYFNSQLLNLLTFILTRTDAGN